jgi:hypothetical protein
VIPKIFDMIDTTGYKVAERTVVKKERNVEKKE